jgi:predicted XRE-type DNA-binding protein
MIIKFKARKNKYSPKQFVRYVLTDKGRIQNPFEAPIVIRNINRFEVDTIHKDFLENAKNLKERKGGTYYLHEIIAIHKKEEKLVTKPMIQDLMNTYISMRKGAKDALVIAKSHQDQHIHVMLSANTCKSSKRDLRMSHKEMRQLLVNFENYHKEKYPELSLSIIHTNKPQREKRNIAQEQQNSRKEKEYQLKLRLGKNKKTNKELVFEKVNLLFDAATSCFDPYKTRTD